MAFKKYQKVEKIEPLKREDLPTTKVDDEKPKLASVKKP